MRGVITVMVITIIFLIRKGSCGGENCSNGICVEENCIEICDFNPCQETMIFCKSHSEFRHSTIIVDFFIRLKNNGTCFDGDGKTDFMCDCSETHKGERCEIEICSIKCMNGGKCSIDILNGNEVETCYCSDEYQGVYCETLRVCNGSPCHNDAQCYLSRNQDSVQAGFICLDETLLWPFSMFFNLTNPYKILEVILLLVS